METLIIIALIVGGLILFAIEVFLIPGISIAGIGSAVCILYAIYSAFTSLGSEAGFITFRSFPVGHHRRHMVVHALKDRRPPVAEENARLPSLTF